MSYREIKEHDYKWMSKEDFIRTHGYHALRLIETWAAIVEERKAAK